MLAGKHTSGPSAGNKVSLTDPPKSRIYPARMMQTTTSQSPLDGLWVLLVSNEGELAAQDSGYHVAEATQA